MTRFLALFLLFFAVSGLRPAGYDHLHPRHRQPPDPQGNDPRPPVTHPGDTVDPLAIERDFNSLWNTGYFEDVRIEKEDTPKGIILNVYVREKPTIREINYKGMSSDHAVGHA